MKVSSVLEGIKSLFIDILFPLLVYILSTLFVSGISEAIGYFYSYKINIILVQAIAALIASIILFPIYLSLAKERNYNIKKFEPRNIKYILGLGVSLCLFFNILLILLNIIQNDTSAIKVSESIMELNPIFALLTVIILIPFIEELLFRALIFKSLEYKYNFYVGAIVSSILFALMHGNISQGLYAFFIGFMFCYVYNRFGGFKYTYLLHLAMNFCSLFFSNIFVHEEAKRKEQLLILILSMILFIITMYRVKQIEKTNS